MKSYIYYAFSFSLEDDRYTVLLNNQCYDSDRNLTNIAARKIDTMISEFLPANETQITTDESVDSDSFISYLCERYQISIAQHLCINFEDDREIAIIKEKEKPLEKDLDVLPEDQC
jgi:hypothetical protein